MHLDWRYSFLPLESAPSNRVFEVLPYSLKLLKKIQPTILFLMPFVMFVLCSVMLVSFLTIKGEMDWLARHLNLLPELLGSC